MGSSKNEKKYVPFFNLILPYVCVLLIPMIIWIVSNNYVVGNNEEKMTKIINDNIENAVKMIDSNLEQIEYTVYLISQDKTLDGFYKKKTLTYEDQLKYKETLATYPGANGLMRELYVYSVESDVMLTQSYILSSPEKFYRYGYAFGDITEQEWAMSIRDGSAAMGYSPEHFRLVSENSGYGVLPYIRNVPIEYPSKRKGIIGISVDKGKLMEGFATLIKEGEGEVFVFDKKGNLIMSEGSSYRDYTDSSEPEKGEYEKISIGGKNVYRYTVRSEKSQWIYNCFVSEKYVFRELVRVNLTLNIISIMAFLIGILICIYFTYLRNRSYNQILNMLGVQNNVPSKRFNFNEFELWKPHLGAIVSENKTMKDSMNNERVWNALLSGSYINEDKLEGWCAESTIQFTHGKFIVIVFEQILPYADDLIYGKNIFLQQLLEKYLSEEFYIYRAGMNVNVAIVNYDVSYEDINLMLKQQIAKMNMEILRKNHTDTMIGIGSEVDSLTKVYCSYNEALKVIRYNRLTGTSHTLFYEELPLEQSMYDYPLETEVRFIRAIENGKTDEAIEILESVYNSNFEKRTLTAERIEELFGEILSTVEKIKQPFFENEEIIDFKSSRITVKGFFDYIRDYVFSTCENIKYSEEEPKDVRFAKVMKWVEENYSDPGVSLVSVGNKFGFSSTGYLSMRFKEVANENFSSYLERIRIEKACELLIEGDKVKAVSEKVGYISDISFRRAFKKRMGVSPKEYVESEFKKNK